MKTVPRPLLSELLLFFHCQEGRSRTLSPCIEDRDKGSSALSHMAPTEHGKNILADEFIQPAGSWRSNHDHCERARVRLSVRRLNPVSSTRQCLSELLSLTHSP